MRDKNKKKLMLDNLLELFPTTREFLDKTEAEERSNKNRQLAKNLKHTRNNRLKEQSDHKKLRDNFRKNTKRNN